jgi:hypothetical protein
LIHRPYFIGQLAPIHRQDHNVIIINVPTTPSFRKIAHNFLRRFKNRFGPNPDQMLVQIAPTMLVNKSLKRSFPTSLVNGWNNYNGVVMNAVNVLSATFVAFI